MKKLVLLSLLVLSVFANVNAVEYETSSNSRNGHIWWQAVDNDASTFWQLAEGETGGSFSIKGEPERKEKIEIDTYLSEDSKIQLFVDGGKGKKAVTGAVKHGPFDGTITFDIPEDIRESKNWTLDITGSKAYETKIYEIRTEKSSVPAEWGKILPFSYEINVEENINLRAERLWDGSVENAWFDPTWYIPWEISQNSDANRVNDIFGTTLGNPSENAEIILHLDGEYEIDTVKVFIQNSYRCLKFEYEQNGIWYDLTTFGPYGQSNNSWQRYSVGNKKVTTKSLKLSFPNGMEQARFISEIEIWGSRKDCIEEDNSGALLLTGSFDEENEAWWYIVDELEKESELEVTFNGEQDSEPAAEINGFPLPVKSSCVINGNSVITYSVDKEKLRTDRQFICVDSKDTESVILRDKRDKGILSSTKNAEIEKITIQHTDGRIDTIDGMGRYIRNILLPSYEQGAIVTYYGSPTSDEYETVELYRPTDVDTEWNGCIIGFTGTSGSQVTAGGAGASRSDRVFWVEQRNLDFYSLKGTLTVKAVKNGKTTEKTYLVKKGNIQNGGVLLSGEQLEYIDSEIYEIQGKTNSRYAKVYINSEEVPVDRNGVFTCSVPVECGYQIIAVEVKENGRTTGYWSKELYVFNPEGIEINLDGIPDYKLTQQSEMTISGTVTNGTGIRLYVNDSQIDVNNGHFSFAVSLEEGENPVVITVEDENGRTAEKTITIIKDTIAPVVTVMYPNNGDYISSSVITLNIVADESDYWYVLNDEPGVYSPIDSYEEEFFLRDDFYDWTLQVYDKAENWTEIIPVQFCIDVTPPERFDIIPDIPTSITNWRDTNDVTISFATTDKTSGIEKYEYTLDGEWHECSSPVYLQDLYDGVHHLFVRAIDRAGNITLESLELFVDITSPLPFKITSEIPESKWVACNQIPTCFSTLDETSGIRNYTISINGEEEIDWIDGNIVSLPDQENTIRITAYDWAGNSYSDEACYFVDVTPPEQFEASFNVVNWTNNNTPQISFSTNDKTSGIAKYEIKLDDGEWTEQVSPYTYPKLEDGVHQTWVRAFDFAGNITTTQMYELKIDTVPPVAVNPCRLIPGNDNMEAKWETTDDDVIAYHLLWTENGITESIIITETSYLKSIPVIGTKIAISVQPEDKAHNMGPVTTALPAVTGMSLTDIKQSEPTVAEFERVKVSIPVNEGNSRIQSVIIRQPDETLPEVKELKEKAENPQISPIYSFTTNQKMDNGMILECEHTEFSKDVLVTIAFDEKVIPDGFLKNNLGLYYYDELWGKWFKEENAIVDIENNQIIALVNHFSSFEVQATLLNDLSAQDIQSSSHMYGNTESVIGDMTVSMDNGTVLTDVLEFTLHGKNGFTFPIRRTYDTQTAKKDGSLINTFMGEMGTREKLKEEGVDVGPEFYTNTRLSNSDVATILTACFKNNGDYSLGMGVGWRLDLPYISSDNSTMMVTIPGIGTYNLTQLDYIRNDSSDSAKRELVFENHYGTDFTFIMKQSKSGSYFKTTETKVLLTDGTEYTFNENGSITEIKDISGTNVLTFVYQNYLLKTISDSNNSTISFAYEKIKSGNIIRPCISEISTSDGRTWTYNYDDTTSNSSHILLMPLLTEAYDAEQRKTTYTYEAESTLLNIGASKLVTKEEVLDSLGVSGVKDFYSFDTYLNLIGSCSVNKLQLLKEITAPQKGTQSITYTVKEFDVPQTILKDLSSSTPKKIKRVIADSVTVTNCSPKETGEEVKLEQKTTYTYDFANIDEEYLVTRSIADDGKTIVVNNFLIRYRGYYRYPQLRGFLDGSVSGTLSKSYSNRKVAVYTKLKSILTYDKVEYAKAAPVAVETSDYEWNEHSNKLNSITTKKNNSTLVKTLEYDNWGNITKEILENYNERNEISTVQGRKITESIYTGTEGMNIIGFPEGISVTTGVTAKGLLLKQCSIATLGTTETYRNYTGYQYNGNGQLIRSSIWNNSKWNTTSITYNTEGRVLRSITPTGVVTNFEYSVKEKTLITTRKTMNVNGYNSEGNPEKDIVIYETVEDLFTGLVLSETDGNTNTVYYQYDKLGRQIKKEYTTEIDGSPTSIKECTSINDSTNVVTITHDDVEDAPLYEKYVYDSLGNVIKQTKYNHKTGESLSNIESELSVILEYDNYGNVISLTDQNGNTTKYEYDYLNRLISQINPETTSEPFSEKKKSAITITYGTGTKTTVNENGVKVIEYLTFDDKPWKVEQCLFASGNSGNPVTLTQYDASGREIKITDSAGQITEITYSPYGQPSHVSKKDAAGKLVTEEIYTFDGDGNISQKKTGLPGNYRWVNYEYDGLGHVIKETYSGSYIAPEESSAEIRITLYSLDKNGNTLAVITGTGSEQSITSYTYTTLNQKKTETDPTGIKTEYYYDRNGNISKLINPNGVALYNYDDYGRLVTAELPPVPGNEGNCIVSYEYDNRGNVIKQISVDGIETIWQYDERNRKTKETVQASGENDIITVWEYRPDGNVEKETTGTLSTSYEYDSIGRVNKTITPDGKYTITTYDKLNRIASTITPTTDGSDYKQSYSYNLFNQITNYNDGTTSISYQYNPFGEEVSREEGPVTGRTAQNLISWTMVYDNFGELIKESRNDGSTWTYGYDTRGLLKTTTDPKGITSTILYDTAGKPTSETRKYGTVTETKTYKYDNAGFMTSANDNGVISYMNLENGIYSQNAYNLLTSYATIVSGKRLETAYTYDKGQRVTSITYPTGQELVYGLDGFGRIKELVSGTVTYAQNGTYDDIGRLEVLTAGNETKRDNTWKKASALLESYNWNIEELGYTSLTWTNGNITGLAKSTGGTTVFNYNARSELINETIDGSNIRMTSRNADGADYLYDTNDVVAKSSMHKLSEAHMLDILGIDEGTDKVTFDFYAASLGVDLYSEKEVNEIRIYSNSDRVAPEYIELYTKADANGAAWVSVDTRTYQWIKERDGWRVRFKTNISAQYLKVHSTWDERDASYTAVDKSTIKDIPQAIVEVFYVVNQRSTSWTLDWRGNRTKQYIVYGNKVDGNGKVATNEVYEYYPHSDLVKRVTGGTDTWYYNYDDNGNLVMKGTVATARATSPVEGNPDFMGWTFSVTEGKVWSYEYDLSNRLVRASTSRKGTANLTETATYTYDWQNLLVKKENAEYTEYSAYTADGKLLYVERSLKNGTDELTEYIWAGSTLWAEKRTAGTESRVYYHHTDYHGSTEAITDEAGVVVWKAGYDVYGNMLEATGVMEFEASYTGKMYDRDTGLYYFNARWYDAELGRFTTPDPARDGTNWLVYCAANPVGHWDPSGLTVLDDYAYQQRTNSQHGSEEYENSFKIEEEAARRNQGVSTEVVTNSETPSLSVMQFAAAVMRIIPYYPAYTTAKNLTYINEKREEAVDWADENWPSWLTLTGSVRMDQDAIAAAMAILRPEIGLAQQSLLYMMPLLEASGVGSQLLLGGNTTSTLGLPTTTAAELAAGAQGTYPYFGIDTWTNTTFPAGSIFVRGWPNGTNCWTTLPTLYESNFCAETLWKMLQVAPDNKWGYRNSVEAYISTEPINGAYGRCLANPQLSDGMGGGAQEYIPDSNSLIQSGILQPLFKAQLK